jgi:oxygen-dependent protoporphyrinogen oxidase
VIVVNLAYPATSKLPIDGFGFLVPDGVGLDILGIVLDSCAVHGQSDGGLVRVSVMIGGHMFPNIFPDSTDSAISIATTACKKYLHLKGVVFSEVNVQREAIPQYHVGHDEKMTELDGWSKGKGVGFVGGWYAGVSVNDCLWNARKVAEGVLEGKEVSGLERCL